MDKLISFVIPTYNSSHTVEQTLNSIFDQKFSDLVEVIVVDDSSTDNTPEVLQKYNRKNHKIVILQLDKNSGPGIARDKGVLASKSNWISFIDSDDKISNNFIETAYKALSSINVVTDIIAFNYSYDTDEDKAIRDDMHLLTCDNQDLIQDYLLDKIENLEMLNLFKKDFLIKNKIFHRSGIHEDIDFLFHCFLKAENIIAIDKLLYIKSKSLESITSSFGINHINGYFDALKRIHAILLMEGSFVKYELYYKIAVVNLFASRLLMFVDNKHKTTDPFGDIYAALCQKIEEIIHILDIDMEGLIFQYGSQKTKYQMVFEKFVLGYKSNFSNKSKKLLDEIHKIKHKTWSCYDLHNSVFLAPEEIRTCCKSYYHKGELKGNVVLYDVEKKPDDNILYEDIKRAKNILHKEINRNSSLDCEACPFLKFDNWNGAPLAQGIKYFPFEDYSKCTM